MPLRYPLTAMERAKSSSVYLPADRVQSSGMAHGLGRANSGRPGSSETQTSSLSSLARPQPLPGRLSTSGLACPAALSTKRSLVPNRQRQSGGGRRRPFAGGGSTLSADANRLERSRRVNRKMRPSSSECCPDRGRQGWPASTVPHSLTTMASPMIVPSLRSMPTDPRRLTIKRLSDHRGFS